MGYPKSVYDKAWQVLTQRKHAAGRLSDQRREEIYRAIPEIRRIDGEMAVGASSITKIVINSPDRAEELINQLARSNLALQEKRRGLLREHGFPEDYLEQQYGCPRCRDQGYVGREMCYCLKNLLEQQAYVQLSSSSVAGDCTFDRFSLQYYPDTSQDGVVPRRMMEDTLAYCERYASTFTPASPSLLFMGNTGLGKTHLSLAIAGAVVREGYGVIYTPVQKLLDRLEAEKFSRDNEARESYTENTRITQTCDLLVLDDLGTEFTTQFSNSVLYNIINSRLIENRPTIISTNLRIGEIEQKYSQRMVSRLVCGYRVMEFFGRDIRMIKMAQTRKGESRGGS